MQSRAHSPASAESPKISAIAVGVAAFQVVLVCAALAIGYVGADRIVLQGVIGSFGGGVAGLAGFAAVALTSRRSHATLGIRPAKVRWILLATAFMASAS